MSGSMPWLHASYRRSGLPLHSVSRRSAVPLHSASAPAPASSCSGFPDWVLLDTVTHMGCSCDSATTAVADTSGGCPIEVSFQVADPPALTRCVVDCPHLTCGHFFDEPPLITGADGAFLLISAIFPKHPDRSQFTDLFVYKSGPGKPSLQLLPHPYPVGYLSNHIGVLSCGDYCLVVVPQRQFDADGLMHYLLHIFSSNTGLWSTKIAKLAPGMKPYCGRFEPTKAFSVGGGSMAWVDLEYGILLFDFVAGDHPVWRRIELPPLMPMNIENQGMGFDGLLPGLDMVRDVIYSNGWFRFIEIGFPQPDDDDDDDVIYNFRWMSAMFKMMIHSGKWEPCGTADSAEISPSDSCFHEIWEFKRKKLTLNTMLSLSPTLDLYNDNIVYMMAKMKDTDPSGWVLAIDTENKKLEKLSPFSEERFHLHRIYQQSDFSKYISDASGIRLTKDMATCTNRQKIELLEANLLDALNLLRNIETHMGSSKNQTQAVYGLNNGRGTESVSGHIRLMGDFDLLLTAPIDAIKSKIRVARGALYNIMETLPSEDLFP